MKKRKKVFPMLHNVPTQLLQMHANDGTHELKLILVVLVKQSPCKDMENCSMVPSINLPPSQQS